MYASLVANLKLIFDFSFIKIICFLYFNAHQNCLNKSIWLFLENANLGCYTLYTATMECSAKLGEVVSPMTALSKTLTSYGVSNNVSSFREAQQVTAQDRARN